MTFPDAIALWLKTGVVTRVHQRRPIRGSDVVGVAIVVAVIAFCAGYMFGR